MADWIDESSSLFGAVLNRQVEAADVVWGFRQDLMAPDVRLAVDQATDEERDLPAVVDDHDHVRLASAPPHRSGPAR